MCVCVRMYAALVSRSIVRRRHRGYPHREIERYLPKAVGAYSSIETYVTGRTV